MAGIAAARSATIDRARDPSWAERLLAFAERSHARAAALIVVLSLACFLPGFASLQPMDRDEPRFAQATKQMLETGDFIDIRFQDEARYKKPIGIHWMQAAAVSAGEALGVPQARTTIWLYRVPSLLGAIGAALLTYWAALAFAGRREAFLAASFMAGSVILMVEARLAKTDAMLLACCVAAMGALARAWLARALPRQPTRTVLIFWIAVALGILVKGPMVVMFTGLAAAVLSIRERSAAWLRGLRPWLGLAIILVAVLPWFVAIAWKSGGEFYRLAVGDDMLGKVTTGQQKHGAPPGFYLVAYFATFWPAALLAAIAAPFAWLHRHEDWAAFLLAWVVPAWIVFEAVPTKLPHYVMPLYPAFAILAVRAMTEGFVGPHRPGARLAYLAMPFIPVGLTAGLCFGTWMLDRTLPWAALPFLLAACGAAIGSWLCFSRAEVTRAALVGVVAAPILAIGVFGFAQPVLQSLKLSPRLAAAAEAAGCPGAPVATLGYREPSLVFLVGTSLDMLETPQEAADFLSQPGCRVLLVDSRFEPAFLQLLGERVTREPAARIAGFNINGGRRTDIGVYRAGR
ncbi:ArnT family glycosyltransferase [Enterovirga aerilata]|uniref:Glycosyltransferase family 39 protein n=1 Tax=Enterovirga aerilata TaxID=2730920 RepID=A0A849IDB4_9HYPH|nr:glycosyltransferase family 39 protein [Enterovirga sp. DB1703]NNM75241.1 glycosyltransferase family 39 protein [Enterovirga sp. DB1703]